MYKKIKPAVKAAPKPKTELSWFERHRREYYIVFGLIIFSLIKFSGLDSLFIKIVVASVPLFIGISGAFVLTPVIDFLHNLGLKRTLAKIITLFLAFAVAIVGLAVLIPYLINQFSTFFSGIVGDRNLAGVIESYLRNKSTSGALSETIDYGTDVNVWLESLITDITTKYSAVKDWIFLDDPTAGTATSAFNQAAWDAWLGLGIDTARVPINLGELTINNLGGAYKIVFSATHSLGSKEYSFVHTLVDAIYNATDLSQYGNMAVNLASVTVSVAFQLLMAIFITIFLLDNYKGLMHWITEHAIPNKRKDREVVAHAIHDSLVGWLKGVTIDFIIMFAMTTGFLFVVGMFAGDGGEQFQKTAIMYGLIMAVCNLIPLIGPYIGMVPIALQGLLIFTETDNMMPLIWALASAGLIQIIESNIFIPLIFGNSTSLNPITILIGISIFGALFGVLGMLLTIPILSTFKNVMRVKGYEVKI